ncbi:hypothetical protein K439DRAFT_1635222 [Ramaria rubella]|nr:hypothetical protein K439DRAFT_1635222 [Ramaria rubella]
MRPPVSPRNSSVVLKKLKHVETLSEIISTLKRLADASPLPIVPLVFSIAQEIINSVVIAKRNIDDTAWIAERICRLVKAIVEQSNIVETQPTNPQFYKHVMEFCDTLKEIQLSLPDITRRVWYLVIFCSRRDKRALEEFKNKLNDAVELFQVQGTIHQGVEVRKLSNIITGLIQWMTKIEALVKQFTTNTSGESKDVQPHPPRPTRTGLFSNWPRSVRGFSERERRPYQIVFKKTPRVWPDREDYSPNPSRVEVRTSSPEMHRRNDPEESPEASAPKAPRVSRTPVRPRGAPTPRATT